MPRKRIPQDELVWLQAKPQERDPYNGCCRFGKTVATFSWFARTARLDAGKDLLQLDPLIFLFSEQNSFGSHRDSAEMTAAIAERFADQCEFCLAKTFSQISAQLSAPYGRRVPADVILLIDFPPRIENGAGRRPF
jgi:hypothetical protein